VAPYQRIGKLGGGGADVPVYLLREPSLPRSRPAVEPPLARAGMPSIFAHDKDGRPDSHRAIVFPHIPTARIHGTLDWFDTAFHGDQIAGQTAQGVRLVDTHQHVAVGKRHRAGVRCDRETETFT